MHIAYKREDDQAEKRKPPSKKEMIARWAIVLERKWRARDRAEAIAKNAERIKKLGRPIFY